jgi:hypothetical protein
VPSRKDETDERTEAQIDQDSIKTGHFALFNWSKKVPAADRFYGVPPGDGEAYHVTVGEIRHVATGDEKEPTVKEAFVTYHKPFEDYERELTPVAILVRARSHSRVFAFRFLTACSATLFLFQPSGWRCSF